jgi:hypothetical protein
MEREEIRDLIKQFVAETRDKHNEYEYAAGYLESKLVEVVMALPKTKRQIFKGELRRDKDEYIRIHKNGSRWPFAK